MKKFLLSFFSVLLLMSITSGNIYANNSFNNLKEGNIPDKSDSRAPSVTIDLDNPTTEPICPNIGSIDISVNVSGGTGPFTIQWTNVTSNTGYQATVDIDPTFCNNTVTVSVSVTDDDDGSITIVNRTFVINDNVPPTITGAIPDHSFDGCNVNDYPAATDITSLEALGLTISDNCTENDQLVVTSADYPSEVCPLEFNRIYTITDACENKATISQKITLTTQPFTIPFPAGREVVECISDTYYPNEYALPVPDFCGNDINAVPSGYVDDPNPLLCAGTRTFIYTYTDPCTGQSEVWEYVFDIVPPPFSVPDNADTTISCPSQAIEPTLHIPDVTVCGQTIPYTLISTVDSQTPLACNSTRTYTYRFEDCEGRTDFWTFTYHVGDTNVFTINVPDYETTVNCVNDIVVPTAADLPEIYDACGDLITLQPVHTNTIDQPGTLTCKGSRTFVYTYTDCSGNTATWNYIVHVNPPTFTITDPPGASTANCVSEMIEPIADLPLVYDECGNEITNIVLKSTIDSPSPLICNGTRKYVYTYTDCAGNTADWTYTYTIGALQPFTLDFPDGDTTVNCVGNISPYHITFPTAYDACGNVITTIQPNGFTDNPNPITCEGSREYSFLYKDCSNNTVEWKYTFTVDRPTFAITAAPGVAYVNCINNAEPPTSLPTIKDACGNILTPSTPVIVNNPEPLTCNGIRTYEYTYTDCTGETDVWTFTYHITPELVINDPPIVENVDCITGVYNPIDLMPPITNSCGFTLDAPQLISTVSVPENITCEGTVTYTFLYTDCANNTATWDYIFNVKVPQLVISEPTVYHTVSCINEIFEPTNLIPPINDMCGNPITNVMLWQIKNEPLGFTCSGTRTYVYRYTDCVGHTADWSYVFQVELPEFTVPHPNGESTVNCLSEIDPPTPPPANDACNNPITNIQQTAIIDQPDPLTCNGSRTYVYTYTDCAGNTAEWQHKFNVNRLPLTITDPPMTVEIHCVDELVEPVQYLPEVTDNCGGVITEYNYTVSSTPDPITCEGTQIYTYTYADCFGNTANWVFTYVLTVEPFTLDDDTEVTVNCIADALIEPHTIEPSVMPNVVDGCANYIGENYTFTTTVDTLDCQGSVTYNYTFSDCKGNTADWQYKYNIVPNPLVIEEDYAEIVVNCPDMALVPPHIVDVSLMPTIYDDCGNDISSAYILSDTITEINCEGYIEYVYTYSDCANNTANWHYRYVIEIPQFDMTALPQEDTVVCKSDAYEPVDLLPAVLDYCGDTITNIVFNGITYDPEPFIQAGTATYSYTYFDCAGNSADWSFTFHITGPEELILDVEPGVANVNCLTDVIDPTYLIPAVHDECGNLLSNPQFMGYTDEPSPITCSGTRVYKYLFTDVVGHTAEWTYTYHIAPTIAPQVPGDMQSTIVRLADAVVPALPTIYDACGRIISNPTIEEFNEPNPLVCQGTRKYTFTYEDCAGNSSQWSYTYILAPNNLYLNVTFWQNGCSGGEGGSIAANAWGGIPPYTYCWKKDSGQVFQSQPTYNENYSFTNLFAGTYEVYVLDANGCRQNVHETINIEINQGYVGYDFKTMCESDLPIIYGDSVIYEAGFHEIVFQTQHECDSVIYLTINAFPSYFSSTQDTICSNDLPYEWRGKLLTQAGTFTDNLLTTTHECDSIFEIDLTVLNSLGEIGDIYGETECVFSSDVVSGKYIYTIDPVEGADYYEWEIRNAPWHIEHDNGTVCTLYVRTKNDIGIISVKAFNDCGASIESSLTMIALAGIDNENGASISIYPNPATDNVNIKFENFEGKTNILIYDTSGRLIDSIEKNLRSKVEYINYNVSAYNNGIYFIHIRNNKTTTTQRIVVQH